MQREARLPKSIHTKAYRDLVAQLADARRAAGLTQQAVADLLGKPQSYVAKAEGYERRLDVVEFLAMAAAVGLDPMPMIGETWVRIERA